MFSDNRIFNSFSGRFFSLVIKQVLISDLEVKKDIYVILRIKFEIFSLKINLIKK